MGNKKEGIDDVEHKRLVLACDSRDVHDAILLNNEVEMMDEKVCHLG